MGAVVMPGAPKPVGEALECLMGTLGRPAPDVLATVFGQWEQIVGSSAALHCRPVAIEGDRLVVEAFDAVWASELRWLADSVVARVNEFSGRERLRSLTVRVAPT